MTYRVIVDHPNLGDQDVYIHGLGTFHNGTTTEIDDEQVERFRSINSVVNLSDAHPETGRRVHMPARGKDPTQLNIFGVKVEKVGDEGNDETNEGGEK
jgi:hypothetical protein